MSLTGVSESDRDTSPGTDKEKTRALSRPVTDTGLIVRSDTISDVV